MYFVLKNVNLKFLFTSDPNDKVNNWAFTSVYIDLRHLNIFHTYKDIIVYDRQSYLEWCNEHVNNNVLIM